MALQEPTTQEIRDTLISYWEARLGQVIPLLPKAVLRVLASGIAAIWTTLYKYGSFSFLQIFPQTASDEELERWGDLVGIIRTPAEAARIELQFTGVDGQEVLTGSRIINNLSNVVYIIDSDVTIAGGVGTTTAVAVTAGSIGNVSNGKVLSFVTPLPSIDNKSTVTDTIDLGIDEELLEVYRGRVVDRFRKTPQGGAFADYEQWALEVATIISAYPYSGDIEGQVKVFIESNSGVDGIPSAGEITQVEDSINQPDRRPVTAEVFVLSIIRTSFTVRVLGLSPDTTEARDSILTFLTQFFLAREPFVEGLSITNKSFISQTEIIQIVSLSLQTNGASFDNATFEITGIGDLLVKFDLGQGEKSKIDPVIIYS